MSVQIRSIMVELIGLVGYEAPLQKIIISAASEIIRSMRGVFGMGFALFSYAYFREKGFRSPSS